MTGFVANGVYKARKMEKWAARKGLIGEPGWEKIADRIGQWLQRTVGGFSGD